VVPLKFEVDSSAPIGRMQLPHFGSNEGGAIGTDSSSRCRSLDAESNTLIRVFALHFGQVTWRPANFVCCSGEIGFSKEHAWHLNFIEDCKL